MNRFDGVHLVVDLAQEHARVVGPVDRAVLVRAAERREEVDDARLDARRVELLGLAEPLLVVGEEEEQLVLPERPAERGAELLLVERELLALRVLGRQLVGLEEEVGRPARLLVPDLVTTWTNAPPLRPNSGGRAVGDDHHLLDRVLVERERRALAAALLAEERVVEVGAVHRDVVVDALLAVDADLVAVRPLHDRRRPA